MSETTTIIIMVTTTIESLPNNGNYEEYALRVITRLIEGVVGYAGLGWGVMGCAEWGVVLSGGLC